MTSASDHAPREIRGRSLVRRAAGWLLALTMLALLAASALRWWHGGVSKWAMAASMAVPAVSVVAAVVVLLGWVITSRKAALALTCAGALIWASNAPQLRYFFSESQPTRAHSIRVATLNTFLGQADPAQVVSLADDADLLALQELPPAQVNAYTKALGNSWRLVGQESDRGRDLAVAMWVRTSVKTTDEQHFGSIDQPGDRATVSVSGKPARVIGMRLVNPWYQPATLWQEGFDQLTEQAQAADEEGLPFIVLGDLNSPPSSIAYSRFLQRSQLRDCAALTGGGLSGTWNLIPAAPIAPVLIDHILVNKATSCQRLRSLRITGSDHRALTATLSW